MSGAVTFVGSVLLATASINNLFIVRIVSFFSMTKYTREFKARITKEAKLSKNISRTAKKFKVPYRTLLRWVAVGNVPV